MRYRITILFCTLSWCTIAQSALPDSIQRRFASVAQDSNYIIRLNVLATNYLKTDPALSRAIAGYVIDKAPQLGYPRGYARGLTVMGNSYWYEGVYEFAQNYYLLAARQYQSIQDSVGLAQTYNNIGEVNKRLGENKQALEYLLRALALKRGDSTRAITLYNIGELHLIMQNYQQAMQYINESLQLARERKNERVMAYDYWSIARIREAQRNDSEAFRYYDMAVELWIKLGETRSLIQTYQDLAHAHRIRGNYALAEDYLEKSTDLSQLIQVPDLRIKTFLEYARLDSALGNYQRAYQHLARHNELKDSVYDLLKVEQIARVQTIYETEIHARENQQLRAAKSLQDSRIRSRNGLIVVASVGLILAGALVTMLIYQRKKILGINQTLQQKNAEILDQNSAIEDQAAALKKLNDTLQELNKSLESRIDQRTRQLLVQNKRLSEYTFLNAHKLRAPVASILGLINLFQRASPEEQEEIVKHLKTCGDQLDEIIRGMNRSLESAIISEGES